jgi:glyoxylate/hydroxypyruvate reductase A
MAETALWAVLSLHRDFYRYAGQQRAGRWQVLPQRRADEVRVLVLGSGEMGRAAALRIADLGYAARGWRRDGTPLLRALAETDIAINLLPLTPETRGLLDARFFAALPAQAAVVNLARGAHVVDDDLLAALDSGHLRHAVLDVFQQEPLPAAHRYWQHPQVTVLPHAAAQTDPRSAAAVAVRNLRAARDGGTLQNLVERQRGY